MGTLMAYLLTVNKTARHGENNGFQRMFMPHRLTLGITFPIEKFQGDQLSMAHQEQLALQAERPGYAALWFRDVPRRATHAGEVGQVFDPWVYPGWIAAHTRTIAPAPAIGNDVLPLLKATSAKAPP
jgi:hypothetical protein